MAQHRIILGTNQRDVEERRDVWLSENPEIKVVQIHPPRPEPWTLLMRIGGANIPRISIEIEYE